MIKRIGRGIRLHDAARNYSVGGIVTPGSLQVSAWPQQFEACANCTCDASTFAYGGRGYCSRCYRIFRRIEDVEAWDRNRRETLKHIAKEGMFDPIVGYENSTALATDGYTDGEFRRFQNRTIQQLRYRLRLLRYREKIRRHEVPVSALMLERKFAEILRLIRPKAIYPQNASYLHKHFDPDERRILYALLEGIIEQAPWRWPVVSREPD